MAGGSAVCYGAVFILVAKCVKVRKPVHMYRCLAHSRNCENPLLATSVCLSVCLSAWNNSAPTGRIFLILEYFSKTC